MKKRFFAGLLACLMVVGLLPLSMLLKPVSAKAASEPYVIDPNTISSVGTGDEGEFTDKNLDSKGYFKIYRKISTNTSAWKGDETSWTPTQNKPRYIQLGGTISYKNEVMQKAIGFTTKSNTSIKVWYYVSDNTRDLCLYEIVDGKLTMLKDENDEATKNQISTVDPADSKGKKTYIVKTFENISSDRTLYLGSKNSTVNIYRIEVTEESKYNVTVVDPATTETIGNVNSKSEGEIFTLKAADTTNFLYWVNSYGRIVSREAEYSFPVYYSDTYTAVYKSEETVVKYMTAYNQVLSEVKLSALIKDGAVDETVIPSKPVRYGYTFSKWSKTVEEIQAEAKAGEKSIEVKPEYILDATTYDVTINGVTEKNQPVNKIITVKSSLGDKFAYWVDSNGNKLSYNSTYSFFVNDIVDIKEVSTDDIDKVEAEGIITCVKQDTVDGKSIIIFEYSVPEDCTIKFAGVVADTSESNLSMSKAKFVGGESTSYKEYRYTLTNASGVAYKVKAVLKYVDKNNELQERESTVYTLN